MAISGKKKLLVFVASFLLVVLALGVYQLFFRANPFDTGAPLLASAAVDERIELIDGDLNTDNLPKGWVHRTFFNVTPTDYSTVEIDGRKALHCATDNSGSILARDLLIKLGDYSVLKWQWKIEKPLVSDIAEDTEAGDDHPARFFVVFVNPDGSRIATEIIWSNQKYAPGDYKIINGFSHYVANGLNENVGKWHEERIDLEAIYAKIGGTSTEADIRLLGFFCDSDNTGGSTSAYFANVGLESRFKR